MYDEYFVWLSSLNLKPRTKVNLLKQYETLNVDILQIDKKYKEKLTEKILDCKEKKAAKNKIDIMKKLGIEMVTYQDYEYPESLKEIYDFPICLYYKGNIGLLKSSKKIAMIGCRNYSQYGKKIALNFSEKLARNQFVIISVCARVIDSFSHIGAIKYKRSTIAVLGNSLEYVYPPENKRLEEEILNKEGLLITEYVVGTKPSKYTFPSRNRIISGISDGVIVVEAKEKSGTLITVDFALEQGKNIYTIPGNITNINSIGTNNLIKVGAKVVTDVNDIIEDFS